MKSLKYMRPIYYQFSDSASWFQISWCLIYLSSFSSLQSIHMLGPSFKSVIIVKKASLVDGVFIYDIMEKELLVFNFSSCSPSYI
jgi:hypothetical protein